VIHSSPQQPGGSVLDWTPALRGGVLSTNPKDYNGPYGWDFDTTLLKQGLWSWLL